MLAGAGFVPGLSLLIIIFRSNGSVTLTLKINNSSLSEM